jgi:hypothetical protein
MDSFDWELVEAAWCHHRQVCAEVKAHVPSEVAAFIAGACWARQVLLGKRENQED